MSQSFLSSYEFDVFLCLLNTIIKSWCKRSVSVFCCRCGYTCILARGVLSRHRPELSWHNFHHCIRTEMPSLELQISTWPWKDPRKIPKCVCLSHFLYLTMTSAENETSFVISAHLCIKTLVGNVSIKDNFFLYNFTKIQKIFSFSLIFLNCVFL